MSSIFDELELDEPDKDVVLINSEPDPQPVKQTVTIDVPRGNLFVFDLETVPDESRYPRPVRPEKVVKPDAAVDLQKLSEGTVAAIKGKVGILSDGQLQALRSIETSGKNRSGVLELIADQLANDDSAFEAEYQAWRNLSFDVFCCRIVALGIEAKGHSVTMIAKTVEEERHLIEVLWEHIAKFAIRCGYNITAFDDAVLMFRSMFLDIPASKLLERKKFTTKQSLDLMTSLFPASQAQKLKEVCRKMGIVPLAGYEMSGDKVLDLVDAGDWDGIANYVHSDAVIEFELYSRLSRYQVF